MSAITDTRFALTQKALDAFCIKFHIPEEVHPILPNQNDTMHERPTRKIRLYTRFFDYANFRFPLSTFLVDVLRHFRINISQLSVIGAAKVSHFKILCRVYGVIPTVGLFQCFYVNSKKIGRMSFSKRSDNAPVCYTKPLDSLKHWNDHFFWVDDFACPASFLWHTAKNVARDPAPVAAEFNAQDFATLVAHPSPFWKFPEAFIEGANIQPVVEVVAPVQPRRQGKRKFAVVDAGGASHPPKKLREDHGTPGGTSVGGKSRSAIKRLLAGAVLNVEVGVAAIPTLPFVTASVSSTLEREAGDHTDFVAEPNLRTFGASQRFVISSDSSHHSGPTIAEAEVDSLARSSVPIMTAVTTVASAVDPALVAKEKFVKHSLFSADSSSGGEPIPTLVPFQILLAMIFLLVVSAPSSTLILIFRKFTFPNGA
ncbi:hypothetical protein Tco_1409852 [Tanacetum coccineum]